MDASLKMITTSRFVCEALDLPIEVEEKIAMELKYLVYVPQITRLCNSLLHLQINLRNPVNVRRIWDFSEDEVIEYEDPHSDYPVEIEPHPTGGIWGGAHYADTYAWRDMACNEMGWWVECIVEGMNKWDVDR